MDKSNLVENFGKSLFGHCPHCDAADSWLEIVRTAVCSKGIRREYHCQQCGMGFTAYFQLTEIEVDQEPQG